MRSRSKQLLTLFAAVLGVTAPALQAGELTLNFDTDVGGATVNGSAKHVASGGVNDSGYVSITDAVNSQQGGLTLPAFDVPSVGSFVIAFQLRMGGGTARPADGMSFNIVPANDPIVNGNVGEDGPGRGVTVSFDTWDNNAGGDAAVSPPVLEIYHNGTSLGNRLSVGTREGGRNPTGDIYTYTHPVTGGTVNFDIFTDGAAPSTPVWEPVVVEYNAQPNGTGLLDVSYKGVKMFDDLPVNLPAGAYRVVLGARTGGANAAHWVDEFQITTAAPAFHSITRTSPGANTDNFGSTNIELDFTDGTAGEFNPASLTATLNGTAIPAANITSVRNGAVTTVTIDPPGDMPRASNQSLAVTYGTGIGAETTVYTLDFRISPVTADTLFVETEDIDFDAGFFVPESQAPDYPGGGYAAVGVPLHLTDYFRTGGDGNNEYRLTEEPNIGMAANGDVNRLPGFDRTANWKVGWNDAGEWNNYTRDFPEAGRNYEIYARLASGGAAMAASLSLVQNNQVEVQVTGELGRFNAPATGGWDTFVMVPLRRGDEIANIVLKGRQVVRFTTLPGNNDNNYLAFVPIETTHKDALVNITPNTGVQGRGTVTFTASIIEQTDVIDPATVRLTIGGQEIANGTAVKGGQVITISGDYTDFGYFASRDAVITFSQGGTTRTVTIPVSSGGGATYRQYHGIGGVAWQEVVNHAKFQSNQPDLVREVPRFEFDQTNPNLDNFGGHLIAYFKPPQTGPYQFNISADDGAALWLSTDDKPYNKVLIAQQPVWSGFREFATQSGGGALPAARVSPMINLEAGRRYYIEAVYHEGGGGDNISVTYRNDEATPWVNGTPGLGEVEPFIGADFGQIPQAQTVLQGRPVTFRGLLVAEAAGEVIYQWLRDGAPIDGAFTGSYTIPAVAASDDGAMFSLQAILNGVTYTTPAVRLTVNPDATPPTIASVRTRNYHELVVTFSEEVQQLDVASLTLDNGATVTAIDHDPAFPRQAMLTVTTAPAAGAKAAGGLVEGTTYTVTVANVTDLAGNAGTGTASVTPVFSPRFAEIEYFRNTGGAVTVASLVDHPKFPQAPDEVVYNSLFEGGSGGQAGIWDNYGASIHGFFVPPRDGQVIFYMSTDDNGELWLSTDENPANKVLIAREPVWNGVRSWLVSDRRPGRENVSGLIDVVGGNKYYIELLFKEGGGGDNGAATFIYGEETEEPANGSAPRLRGTAVGVVVNGAGRSITFNGPLTGSPILEGRTGALTGAVTVSPEGSTIGYQWSRRLAGEETFTEIDGANSATLNVGPVADTDAGTVYRLTAFTLGASATADVTLEVTQDTQAPGVVGTSAAGVRVGANAADIGLVFNEPVDAASAENAANYTTTVGTVASAQFFAANNGVAVRVNGLAAGQSGNITITGVTDPYGNAMPAVTLPFTVGPMSWTGVGGDESGLDEGVVALSEDDFDVISGGLGQWSTYDESTFVYEEITGDFDKKVRVAFQESSSQWARAGLIVRENLDAGKARLVAGQDPATEGFSRYQKVHVNPVTTAMGTAGNNAHELNRRTTRGGETDAAATSNNAPPPYPNAWVRLQRVGDVLTMYRSENGTDWVQLGTTTLLNLAATVFVGPDYAPEVANINPTELRRPFLAQFRDYGDVVTEPGAEISIEDTATGVRITFTGTLYSADSVEGPWSPVAGATSPHDVAVPAGAGAKFYVAGPAPQ